MKHFPNFRSFCQIRMKNIQARNNSNQLLSVRFISQSSLRDMKINKERNAYTNIIGIWRIYTSLNEKTLNFLSQSFFTLHTLLLDSITSFWFSIVRISMSMDNISCSLLAGFSSRQLNILLAVYHLDELQPKTWSVCFSNLGAHPYHGAT